MSDELREKVARALYDVLEGPVNNADFGRQTRQWELSLTLADAAIALIWNEAMEEAAIKIEQKCRALPKSDRLRAYDFASVVRELKEPK